MGKEDRVRCHGMAVKSPSSFHVRDESIDHLAHVFHVQSGSMVGGIGGGGAQELCNRLYTALLSFGISLNDESGCPHSENQTVTASVKRKGGFLNHVVGGRGSGGGEATRNPFPHVIAGNVVAADDHHAVNPAGIEPVLSDAERCRG